MPLFVRPVGGAGATDDLADAPRLTAGDASCGERRRAQAFGCPRPAGSHRFHGCIIASFPKPAIECPSNLASAMGVVGPSPDQEETRACSTISQLAFATSRDRRRFTTRRCKRSAIVA